MLLEVFVFYQYHTWQLLSTIIIINNNKKINITTKSTLSQHSLSGGLWTWEGRQLRQCIILYGVCRSWEHNNMKETQSLIMLVSLSSLSSLGWSLKITSAVSMWWVFLLVETCLKVTFTSLPFAPLVSSTWSPICNFAAPWISVPFFSSSAVSTVARSRQLSSSSSFSLMTLWPLPLFHRLAFQSETWR